MEKNLQITQQVKAIMDQMNESQQAVLVDALKHYIGEYEKLNKVVDPVSLAYGFQKNIQENIDEQLKDESITSSCSLGCSFCCYMKVDISIDEAHLILEYCKDQNIDIDQNYLKKQSASFDKLKYAEKKCHFLDDKGHCCIYEYRPMSCRKLNVVTDPEQCNMEKNPKAQVGRITNAIAEIMTCAVLQSTEFGLMSTMLLKAKSNN